MQQLATAPPQFSHVNSAAALDDYISLYKSRVLTLLNNPDLPINTATPVAQVTTTVEQHVDQIVVRDILSDTHTDTQSSVNPTTVRRLSHDGVQTVTPVQVVDTQSDIDSIVVQHTAGAANAVHHDTHQVMFVLPVTLPTSSTVSPTSSNNTPPHPDHRTTLANHNHSPLTKISPDTLLFIEDAKRRHMSYVDRIHTVTQHHRASPHNRRLSITDPAAPVSPCTAAIAMKYEVSPVDDVSSAAMSVSSSSDGRSSSGDDTDQSDAGTHKSHRQHRRRKRRRDKPSSSTGDIKAVMHSRTELLKSLLSEFNSCMRTVQQPGRTQAVHSEVDTSHPPSPTSTSPQHTHDARQLDMSPVSSPLMSHRVLHGELDDTLQLNQPHMDVLTPVIVSSLDALPPVIHQITNQHVITEQVTTIAAHNASVQAHIVTTAHPSDCMCPVCCTPPQPSLQFKHLTGPASECLHYTVLQRGMSMSAVEDEQPSTGTSEQAHAPVIEQQVAPTLGRRGSELELYLRQLQLTKVDQLERSITSSYATHPKVSYDSDSGDDDVDTNEVDIRHQQSITKHPSYSVHTASSIHSRAGSSISQTARRTARQTNDENTDININLESSISNIDRLNQLLK